MMKLPNTFPVLLISLLVACAAQAQTSATNVRLRTDPTVRKVIIEYELPQVLSDDSIYIELETASGRILRPISVNGDVGKALKPGNKKLIAWDVVRDNIRLDEDVKVLLRVARMVSVASPATAVAAVVDKTTSTAATATQKAPDRVAESGSRAPESVVRRKSPLPIIGWVATAGLAGYATVLALGLNKDADEYNAKPYAEDAADLQRYQDLKAKIDKDKGMFTIVAGAAAVVAVANVVYTVVRRPNASRTSLLIQSGSQVTSVGISRRF
jgi:hypothetical protein